MPLSTSNIPSKTTALNNKISPSGGLFSGMNTSNIYNQPGINQNLLAGTLQNTAPMPQSTLATAPKPNPYNIQQPAPQQPYQNYFGGGTTTNTKTAPPKEQFNPSGAPITTSSSVTKPPPSTGTGVLPPLVSGSVSYPSIVSSLVDKSQTPNPIATQAGTALNQLSQNNPGNSGQAYQDYQQAINELNDLKSNIAKQYTNIDAAGVPLDYKGGMEQILNRQYASQLDAAQQKVSEKAAALGYQVSGQQTQNQGYASAGGIGNTQQGHAITGLGTAAGYAAPQFGAPGQYGYNPMNPGESNAAIAPLVEQYAQMAANNQLGGIPSSFMQNPALAAQIYARAQQLNPSFNVNTAQGIGSAQQYTSQLAGTAAADANAGIYGSALTEASGIQASAQTIAQFGTQLLNTMQQGGINPTASRFVNKTIQQVEGELSSPEYAQFNTNIQGLQAQISSLLGRGEIPSTATAGAKAIADGYLPFNAIESTLKQVIDEANAFSLSKQTQASNAYSNLTGNNGSQPNPWH